MAHLTNQYSSSLIKEASVAIIVWHIFLQNEMSFQSTNTFKITIYIKNNALYMLWCRKKSYSSRQNICRYNIYVALTTLWASELLSFVRVNQGPSFAAYHLLNGAKGQTTYVLHEHVLSSMCSLALTFQHLSGVNKKQKKSQAVHRNNKNPLHGWMILTTKNTLHCSGWVIII